MNTTFFGFGTPHKSKFHMAYDILLTGQAGSNHLMSTMMMSKALKSDKGRTGLAGWHHKATEKSSGTN